MRELDDSYVEGILSRVGKISVSEQLANKADRWFEEHLRESARASEAVGKRRRAVMPRALRVAVAAATVLLVVVLAWWLLSRSDVMPSAYAQLMEVVENSQKAQWLHARGTVSGQDVEMWLSLRPFIAFVRRGDHVEALDAEAHRQHSYDPVTNTLTIQYVPGTPAEVSQAPNFLSLVMAQLKEGHVQITTSREVAGGAEYVVYTVTSVEGGQQATLTVDASTQRLVKMESQDPQSPCGPGPFQMDFEYPASGPVDIYALGVPRNAKIVDKMPAVGILDLYQNVEKARERFAHTYYAIIYQGTPDSKGSYDLDQVTVVYKKNGKYRVERYRLYLDEMVSTDALRQLRELAPPDDMAALEAWTKTRRVAEIYFGDAVARSEATRIKLASDGRLDRYTADSEHLLTDTVEKYTFSWPVSRRNAVMLGPKEGSHGELVGTGYTSQGLVSHGDIIYLPSSVHKFWNPRRDYACEEEEMVSDVRAPWVRDKDWLKDADPEKIRKRWLSDAPKISEYRSVRTQKVEEYGQTAGGQWYAKRILEESTRSTSDRSSRTVVFIHLDTTRDIPDELLDPNSVTGEMFRAEEEKPE